MTRTPVHTVAILISLFSLLSADISAHDAENKKARSTSKYSGNTGSVPIIAELTFFSNDHIEGSYFTSNNLPKYLLRGHNHKDGEIFLREYTQEDGVWGVTASFTLKKSVQNGKVIWSGTVINTDGRKFPMILRKEN